MAICRCSLDLCVLEDAACSGNIRHVVPNEGSGFTGCANRVRRPSDDQIDDEAAGEPTVTISDRSVGGHRPTKLVGRENR